MPSQYPPFHKYVPYVYIITELVLLIVLLSSRHTPWNKSPLLVLIILIGISYIVYLILVRINCYGGSDQSNPALPYSQTNPSLTGSHISTINSNSYPTFANYRFGNIRDRLRRIASNRSSRDDEDSYHDMTQSLPVPPPTYTNALEGEGLPPPYNAKIISSSEHVDIVVNNAHESIASDVSSVEGIQVPQRALPHSRISNITAERPPISPRSSHSTRSRTSLPLSEQTLSNSQNGQSQQEMHSQQTVLAFNQS